MLQSRHRREKIFGPAPSHPLDGNAKARVWAAASAYNMANRQPRQHQGPLTWVHRLTKIRHREQDLFGAWGSVWQVIRTSNAYQFLDPLDREPGRRVWCKSENPARPQNLEKKKDGARPDGAQVIQEETSQAPPEPAERSAIALQREHGLPSAAPLSDTERAALIARLDTRPTKADWVAWDRELDAMVTAKLGAA